MRRDGPGSEGAPGGRPPVRKHFGETLRVNRYSYGLTRDEYALPSKKNWTWEPREMFTEKQWAAHAWMYEDEDHKLYSDEFCALQREAALETST